MVQGRARLSQSVGVGGMNSAAELEHLLRGRIRELAAELLPGGHLAAGGREWRCGSIDGEAGRSLSVSLAGKRAGLWTDHGGVARGGALDLIRAVRFSYDRGFRRTMDWARHWLRLAPAPVAARPMAPRRAEETGAAAQLEADLIWRQARPLSRGDPVDRYLAGRGIDLARLAELGGGKLPAVLRFHPRLRNLESRRPWSAMVAAISDPAGRRVAVHRTWLMVGADGGVHKAPVETAKMTRGSYRGGCIRLWHGGAGRAWDAAGVGDTLAIAEGIEDAMSVIAARPAWFVAAAVSLGAMLSTQLPPVGTIVLITQNDAPDSKAAELLQRVRQRFRGLGKTLLLLRPPPDVKDLNDAIARMPPPGTPAAD